MIVDRGNDSEPRSHFSCQRGTNPLLQTQRTKLQQRRSVVNEQINKELRLKGGAEKLLKATNDKRVKEHISLELNFVNSNIQVLKHDLEQLNTCVQVYQNDKSSRQHIPYIALGLKETKPIDPLQPFKDFIQEHYSDEPSRYEEAVHNFADLRTLVTTSLKRDESGVKLLYEYFSQLYFVEKRFFSPLRPLGIYFQWFDSLTGVPAVQRSVAFEKGSVLFNLIALHTQIGAKQDRDTVEGLAVALNHFSCAAGALNHLKENFSHSPCADMRWDTVESLEGLMLAQAQECFCEQQELKMTGKLGLKEAFHLSEECAQVGMMYGKVHQQLNRVELKDVIPLDWISLVSFKMLHFNALAHYYTAFGVSAIRDKEVGLRDAFRRHFNQTSQLPTNIPSFSPDSSSIGRYFSTSTMLNVAEPPESLMEKKVLAKTHLRETLALYDDCLFNVRVTHFSESPAFTVISYCRSRAARKLEELDGSEDFVDYFEPVPITPRTEQSATATPPDFKRFKMPDPFRDLGPLTVFNAKSQWSAPRVVTMVKSDSFPGFGFSVKGDCPASISSVEPGGLADRVGVNTGDFIVGIQADRNTWLSAKWFRHEEVVRHIRESGRMLVLSLVTPKTSASITTSNSSGYSSSTMSSSLSMGTLPRTAKPKDTEKPFGSLKSAKDKKEKRTSTSSTWSIKRLLFAKQKFKSEPELNRLGLYRSEISLR